MTNDMQALARAITQFLTILALSLLPLSSEAGGTAPTATKSKAKSRLNTNIYEKEAGSISFSDEVDVIREMAGEQQVKFKNHPGFYRIPEGNSKMQARLVKAKKSNLPIAVVADPDNLILQEVSLDGI